MAFLLDIPFEDKMVARKYPELSYSQERGYWIFSGAVLPEELKVFAPEKYTWGHYQVLKRHPNSEGTLDTGAVTLRPDQEDDRKKLLKAFESGFPEVLVASSTGVGKTYTSLATAHALPNSGKILIVCPVSAIAGWRRSIRMMGEHGKNHAVVSYGSWKRLIKPPAAVNLPRGKKKRQKTASSLAHATQGTSRVNWDVIIFDEAHMLGNPESQRARAASTLVRTSEGCRVIKISATIGSNPLKLAHLHRSIRRVAPRGMPKQFLTLKAWSAWCSSVGMSIDSYGKWEYNTKDLDLVNKWFFHGETPWVVRSTPPWKETARFLTPISLSVPEKLAYKQSWDTFQKTKQDIEEAYREGKLSESERRQKGLAALIRYRQKAGLLKAPHVAEYVNDLLENSNLQVAVSAEFIETVEALRSGIKSPCSVFTGQNLQERESERLAFQRGDRRVIIFTASESFDLHESAHDANGVPRIQVCAEPSWSPLLMKQKEGRTNRDGVNAPVMYMAAEGTIDEKIISNCMKGFAGIDRMMGAKESTFSSSN